MHIDQLELLNQEIAAIARAGMPLDTGLRQLANDLPGRMRSVVQQLSDQLAQGMSVEQAVRELPGNIPHAYRNLVIAGCRSGNLSVALEAATKTWRRVVELRRQLGTACVYPLFLLTLASIMFASFNQTLITSYRDSFDFAKTPPHPAAAFCMQVADWYRPFAIPTMLATLGIAALIWWNSSRSTALATRWVECIFSPLPSGRRLIQSSHHGTLVTLLRSLIANDVALPEAITLAAEATGNKVLIANAMQTAEVWRQGGQPQPSDISTASVHPFVLWLLQNSPDKNMLLFSLNQLADHFEQEVRSAVRSLTVILPVISTVLFAGSITAFYALIALVPWTNFLQSLGEIR